MLNIRHSQIMQNLDLTFRKINETIKWWTSWSEREQRQLKFDGIKLNIFTFKGKINLEPYFEWKLKVEHMLTCNDYNEEQMMKLVATEYLDYALTWWNKY